MQDAPGDALTAFLDHLARHRFAIGTRETVDAHALMFAVSAVGDAASSLRDRLALLRPLLSRTPEQQRRFGELLDEWSAARASPSAVHDASTGGSTAPGDRSRRRVVWLGLCAIVALLAILLIPRFFHESKVVDPGPVTTDTTTQTDDAPTADPQPVVLDTPGELPLDPVTGEPVNPQRWLDLASIAAGLALAAMLAWYGLRRIALQPLSTDARLDQRTLFGEQVALIGRGARDAPRLLRTVSRELRRPRQTGRLGLDIERTIVATLREGGAFTARHRPLFGTPEYVVLIQSHGPHDQLARAAGEVVAALERQGVAVDVYRFTGDPDLCTPMRLRQTDARSGVVGHGRAIRFRDLATRSADQRLLVFSDVDAWLDPIAGGWREGLQGMNAFAAFALFTPLPVPSWGTAEQWIARQGTLVLPLQLLALASAADWLVSQRAFIVLDPDWPVTYPPRLRDNPGAWVARQTAPPPDEIEGLLFELALYLGPRRMQVLSACAVFPVPSWPITLALLRLLDGNEAGEVADVMALAALPWYREGSWPDWLRDALQARLDPERRDKVLAELRHRLDAASLGRPASGAEALSEVAVEPRLVDRVRAAWRRFATDRWLSRGAGRLRRDVLFLGFVQRGVLPRLMLMVPPGLRRLLFRQGMPLLGVRPGVAIAGALLVVAGVALQLPPVRAWTEARLKPDITRGVPLVAELAANGAAIGAIAFSADGQWIAAGAADGSVRIWNREGRFSNELRPAGDDAVLRVDFGPDGRLLAVTAKNLVVFMRDGTKTSLAASDLLVDALLSSDGKSVYTASPKGTVRSTLLGVGTSNFSSSTTFPITRLALSPGGRLLAVASEGDAFEYTLKVSRTKRGQVDRRLLAGSTIVDVDYGSDDRLVMVDRMHAVRRGDGSLIATGMLARAQRAGQQFVAVADDDAVGLVGMDGQPVARMRLPKNVAALAFSPNSRQLVAADAGGTVRLWGENLAVADPSATWLVEGRPVVPDTSPRSVPSGPSTSGVTRTGQTVPNLVGLGADGLDAALAPLERAGIKVSRTARTSASSCSGVVLSQKPAAGSPVASGTLIDVDIAQSDTQFYPLICRGSPKPPTVGSLRTPGYERLEFDLLAGTAPAARGLLPGQCAWVDRAFRPGEPDHLEMDVTPGMKKTLVPLLSSPVGYVRFMAVNEGKSFRAGCAAPVAAPGPAQSDANGTDDSTPGYAKGTMLASGKADGVAMAQSRQVLPGDAELASIGAFCRIAIRGRYPIDTKASDEIALDDFRSLFAPGGRLDAYFTKYLAASVDTSSRPWRFKPVDARTPEAGSMLLQFERAQAIREAFFGSGDRLGLQLQLRPLEIDPSVIRLVIDIDGQTVRYDKGIATPASIRWPGDGAPRANVDITLGTSKQAASKRFDGPWSLFRLFDYAKAKPTAAPERFLATFPITGADGRSRENRFEVTTSSLRNPFTLGELHTFACPAGQ